LTPARRILKVTHQGAAQVDDEHGTERAMSMIALLWKLQDYSLEFKKFYTIKTKIDHLSE